MIVCPAPPTTEGACQVNVIWLEFVPASSLAKFYGALDTVHIGIAAPLPLADVNESPMMFTAMIFAYTLAELPSEKGAALNSDVGIVQVLLLTMLPFDPSQFVVSKDHVTPSL
jgi:hypothetical protein